MLEIHRHQREGAPWTYALLDRRQREIAERARVGEQGALLLSEVAPVITLGRRTPTCDLLMSPELLEAQGIEIYPTDRGGLATYHGPGQWVLFAVDRLEVLTGDRRGVRKAVEALLEIGLEAARHYEPRAEIRSRELLGVWSPRGKVASVGVHIDRGVLLHGLSVNGFKTPQSFLGIRPCGLDAGVDFLLGESASSTDFEVLGKHLAGSAFRRFWIDGRSI